MAEDARISCGLPAHPKMRKLLRRLGPEGGWSLVCLLLWTASNRWDGDLRGLSGEDVELASEWQGEQGAFVAALVQVGFLEGEPGRFIVHDWAEHNPWATFRGQRVQAAKAAAAARWQRTSPQERSEAGRQAANARWERDRAMHADACDSHALCVRDAYDMRTPCVPTTQPNPTQHHEAIKTVSPEPDKPASGPAVITLPCVGKGPKQFLVIEHQIVEWCEAFPGVDVAAELSHVRAWLNANPTRQKTHRGMARFLVNWFSRSQNRNGGNGNGNSRHSITNEVIDRAAEKLAL